MSDDGFDDELDPVTNSVEFSARGMVAAMDGNHQAAMAVVDELEAQGVLLIPTAVFVMAQEFAERAMPIIEGLELAIDNLECRALRVSVAHRDVNDGSNLCPECGSAWPCATYAWTRRGSERTVLDTWFPNENEETSWPSSDQ